MLQISGVLYGTSVWDSLTLRSRASCGCCPRSEFLCWRWAVRCPVLFLTFLIAVTKRQAEAALWKRFLWAPDFSLSLREGREEVTAVVGGRGASQFDKSGNRAGIQNRARLWSFVSHFCCGPLPQAVPSTQEFYSPSASTAVSHAWGPFTHGTIVQAWQNEV